MQVSGFDDEEACGEALQRAIDAEFLYEAELYPERVIAFRHPLTLEVAYGTQLAEQRARTHAAVAQATIDLNPERHDELAGLIAHHFEAGGELREAARWSARGAYWAGHSQPREAMRMWQSVMRLVPDPEEDAEASRLAVNSRLMLLDYAWRLGMDEGRGSEAGRRGGGDRDEDRRQALAGAAEDRHRGAAGEAARPRSNGWPPPRRRPSSPTRPATSTCGSRSARSPPIRT